MPPLAAAAATASGSSVLELLAASNLVDRWAADAPDPLGYHRPSSATKGIARQRTARPCTLHWNVTSRTVTACLAIAYSGR